MTNEVVLKLKPTDMYKIEVGLWRASEYHRVNAKKFKSKQSKKESEQLAKEYKELRDELCKQAWGK